MFWRINSNKLLVIYKLFRTLWKRNGDQLKTWIKNRKRIFLKVINSNVTQYVDVESSCMNKAKVDTKKIDEWTDHSAFEFGRNQRLVFEGDFLFVFLQHLHFAPVQASRLNQGNRTLARALQYELLQQTKKYAIHKNGENPNVKTFDIPRSNLRVNPRD